MSYHHLSTYERGRIEALNELGLFQPNHSKTIRGGIDPALTERSGETLPKRNTKLKLHRRNISNEEGTRDQRGNGKKIWQTASSSGCVKHGRPNRSLIPKQWEESASNDLSMALQGQTFAGDSQRASAKGKRLKPAEKRGKFAIGTSISERPKEVRSRKTFGHWELDTMVSSRGEKAKVASLLL